MQPNRKLLQIPIPRLLPVTIAAIALLLLVKSANLVLAASAGTPAAASPPAGASPPAQPITDNSVPKPQWHGVSADGPKDTGRAAPASALQSVDPPPISDSERSLLTDLRQRRQILDTQAAALTVRGTMLTAVEKRLDERVQELKLLQKSLEDLEVQRKQRDESNWNGLVKLYEAMKPRDAATIFNDLDLPVLLPVLDRMKEAKAAPILAAMLPERARQVTEALAQARTKANTVPSPSIGSTAGG